MPGTSERSHFGGRPETLHTVRTAVVPSFGKDVKRAIELPQTTPNYPKSPSNHHLYILNSQYRSIYTYILYVYTYKIHILTHFGAYIGLFADLN